MTSKELQEYIEGQAESQTLDFKDDCHWNAATYARDLLAMANVKDVGKMIIGVEEKLRFRAVGVSTHNTATYKIDLMKDQMRKYADPYVDFSVQ